jgi:tetratricopeptide (TPR) repeat protein
VDIVHFDGHGVFDARGGLPGRAKREAARRGGREEDFTRDKKAEETPDPDSPPNMGYLLFEGEDGENDYVSAEKLGANLHRHKVALVVLSACQSAAVGKEDGAAVERPMGSVAVRLTATGIPAVIAMTHSVLVPTTQALFGVFYKELGRRKGLGESLDNARRYLVNHPEKYEIQRGAERVWLELHDWFLPALYQSGNDLPLLNEPQAAPETVAAPSNLPDAPETGFFGRSRELWDIERWFSAKTRRITLTGFGGQGKTALALEAGRWLLRTGSFRAAVWVDYARIQSRDAVTVAVNNIGSVLGETLADADAATEALRKMPTLVILDNLEALEAEALKELLDAAVKWSEANGSRVLCTTRRPDFEHPQYRVEGTLVHRRIRLEGLGSRGAPGDAIEWFTELRKMPPEPTAPTPNREAIIDLFDTVKFHPLSIRVLAQQLKTRRPAELGRRLEELLSGERKDDASAAAPAEDTPEGLLASLQLSLDGLDDAAREVLPRLGVFQGGAFEDDLLAITGIPESDWQALRGQLEDAALIEAENVPGVNFPFLRFHPTLAPMLWAQLGPDDQVRLSAAHRQRYAAFAGYLYHEDSRHPHQARAIVRRELPNLLHAVHAALDAGNPEAVDFADSVNRFLSIFGLKRESEALVAKSQAAAGEAGSKTWRLAQSSRGEELLRAGQATAAAKIFQDMLVQLGDAPSYDKAVTLAHLGRCLLSGGRPHEAAQCDLDAVVIFDKLEQGDEVKRSRAACMTDLASALCEMGKYAEARKAYEDSLKAKVELGDLRAQGVTLAQLGRLAMVEGRLNEAIERYQAALDLSQQLREPLMEAVAWHQLGVIFHKASQWDEAERHYRESARIEEEHGHLAGAAQTWNQLAMVAELAGKPEAAEAWYRKAIKALRDAGDLLSASRALNNLADLLQSRPGRLAEAQQSAEESLNIKRTLEPGMAEIWTTYNILAKIADKEAEATSNAVRKVELETQACDYRRQSRNAKWDFPGTRHELQCHLPLILGVIAAVQETTYRAMLEQSLPVLEQHGWGDLATVFRRILDGERDEETLCEFLDFQKSVIVMAILRGLADPSSLQDLIAAAEAGAETGE